LIAPVPVHIGDRRLKIVLFDIYGTLFDGTHLNFSL